MLWRSRLDGRVSALKTRRSGDGLTARRRAVARALFVATGAVAIAAPITAEAYCRSTTCTGDCPRDADGCKTSGEKLYWKGGCVGFSLQENGSVHIPMKYIEQVAQKSFVAWTELDCPDGLSTISFSELDPVACHEAEYNSGGTNANAIIFQDYKWKYTSVDNTLAKTTVTFDADTGEILDSDIEVNHANNNFTINDDVVEYDLQSVLTHEIGHFIGLDHSPDFTATMYAGYEPGTIDQRTLEQDDVDAACAVYPPSRQVSCDPTPKGGLGDQCGGADPDPPTPPPGCSTSAAAGMDTERGVAVGAIAVAGLSWIRRRARRRGRDADRAPSLG
jgi:hypothetical protein